MATTALKSSLSLEMKITLELTLEEARALRQIVKYGHKAFLEGYYKQLGKSYLQPYENGVKSLFETIDENLPYKLHNADKIIQAVNDIKAMNK